MIKTGTAFADKNLVAKKGAGRYLTEDNGHVMDLLVCPF